MSSDPPDSVPLRSARDSERETRLYLLCCGLLGALALTPIWLYRFVPMQDYPQHLFLAQVVNTIASPEHDWAEHYERNLRFGPYSLYYFLMFAFSRVVDIEAAGKLVLSLYVLLCAGFAASEARRRSTGPTPWPLLLVFPLLFNQAYFMGFVSYLLSIPLVLIALRELESFAARPVQPVSALRQLVWLLLIFLAHPYSLLVYAVLAFATALTLRREPGQFDRALLPPCLLLGLLALWYLVAHTGTASPDGAEWRLRWWPLAGTLGFSALPFTGMRVHGGLKPLGVLQAGLWVSAVVVLVGAALRQRGPTRYSRATQLQLLLCLAGVLALPFASKSWLGLLSYFNLRLAVFVYLLLALLASQLWLARWERALCATLAAALCITPFALHRSVSAEIAEILPVLEAMEPGQRVLPEYPYGGSAHLDPRYFYRFHSHDHAYYHVLVGGGANPLLFDSPVQPIRFRAPTTSEDGGETPTLDRLTTDYRYRLRRHRSDDPGDAPRPGEAVRLRTARWTLIERAR